MTRQSQEQTAARHDNHFELDRLKNKTEAQKFLIASGFKRCRSRFFDDCSKGLIPVANDGSLSRLDVLEYGRSFTNKSLANIPRCPFIESSIKKEARKQSRIQKRQMDALQNEIPGIIEKTLTDVIMDMLTNGGSEPIDAQKPESLRLLSESVLKAIFLLIDKIYQKKSGRSENE